MKRSNTRGALGLAVVLAAIVSCVGQREELEPSERRALEESIEAGTDIGEPREGAWPSESQYFRIHLEAASTCSGWLWKTQTALARGWISPVDDADPSPLPAHGSVDMQISVLNGLFAGAAVWTTTGTAPGQVFERTYALDGNAVSDPCGCLLVFAEANGFGRVNLRAKRLICPQGTTYEPPDPPP